MISRETRRLLITVIVAIAALWVLARIRFQERPAAATPVPNMLAQLRPASSYDDLARLIADIRPAILAAVSPSAGAPALRVREDAAVTLRPAAADTIVATNRATGLSIVRRPRADMPGVMPWVPRLLDYPRYLVVVEVTGEHVALRPVFVGGLYPVTSPLWSGEIWLLPPNTAIPPGTFVFTTEGALAGLSVAHGGQAAIVPAALLTAAVDELQRPRGSAGELGITVEPLSPAFVSATGGAVGLVVTAIDPKGPAAGKLVATEVIDAIDGEEMRTADHWRARVARVSAGDALTLRVRGADGVRNVPMTAAAPIPADEPAQEGDDDVPLGLRLRAIPGV
ncbi:MAG TPA: PDZ domain-containing protein, partial [Vicinamibacterales bacterium]|nr:PDZ domain-containing protein [Vicinamibacterales bacterium]